MYVLIALVTLIGYGVHFVTAPETPEEVLERFENQYDSIHQRSPRFLFSYPGPPSSAIYGKNHNLYKHM